MFACCRLRLSGRLKISGPCLLWRVATEPWTLDPFASKLQGPEHRPQTVGLLGSGHPEEDYTEESQAKGG